MSGYFILFVLALSCQLGGVASQEETLRLLTIGDSTDRCNLQDFCQKFKGHLCSDENCTISTVPNQKLLSEFLNIYPDLPAPYPNSWAIEYCEVSEPKILMALLFERTGVQPYCPWHWPQGPYSDKFCKETKDASKTEITMKDTFPALYGPIMRKMILALGGEPHAVTMQSHLWDVSLKFHRRLNGRMCDSPVARKPFVTSWAKNATDFIQIVRESVGPKPFLVWRTGNRRKPPREEMCKNLIMDEMNAESVFFTKGLDVHRLAYSELLDPPCRDTIHPKQEVTMKYMHSLMKLIAQRVPAVAKTLEMFST